MRRPLALSLAAAAFAGALLTLSAPAANACQPEYCPPPPPWCHVPALSRFCIPPY
jgi:hypothetical protein